MTSEQFEQVVDEQISRCKDILIVKAREYATEDRLHNFRTAAELEGISPRQALAGMMAKHTVSVYDMCMSDEIYSDEMWNEKITDHINYLLLLRALVSEENDVNRWAEKLFGSESCTKDDWLEQFSTMSRRMKTLISSP